MQSDLQRHAEYLLSCGRVLEAKNILVNQLEHTPRDIRLRTLLTESLIELGEIERAVLELEAIRALSPQASQVDILLKRIKKKKGLLDASTSMQDVVQELGDFDDESEDTIIVEPQSPESLVAEAELDPPTREVPRLSPEQLLAYGSEDATMDWSAISITEKVAGGASLPEEAKTENLPRVSQARQPNSNIGSFNRVSPEILKGASSLNLRPRQLKKNPDSGLDSYLARVIGTPNQNKEQAKPSVAKSALERKALPKTQALARPEESEVIEISQVFEITDSDDLAPTEPFPTKELPRPQKAPLPPPTTPFSKPQFPTAPRREVSPTAAAAPSRPSNLVLADRGDAEDATTTNLPPLQAKEEIERAQAYALQAQFRQEHIQWKPIISRSLATMGVAFLAYLLLWFPMTWERKLASRLDHNLAQASQHSQGGDFSSTKEAIGLLREVPEMHGSHSILLDEVLEWYLTTIWRSDTIHSRRDEANQQLAYLLAYGTYRYDASWEVAAKEALAKLTSDESLYGMLAQAYLNLNADKDIDLGPWSQLLPTPALIELEAEIALKKHNSGRSLAAAQLYSQLKAKTPKALSLLLRAWFAEAPNEALKRVDGYRKLVGKDHISLGLLHAEILVAFGGNPEEELNQYLAFESPLAPKERARAHYLLALLEASRGQAAEAEIQLQTALKLDYGNVDFSSLLIKQYLDQGRHIEAERLLRESLELHPEATQLLVRKAQLLLQTGEVAAGLAILEKLHTANARAAYQLAYVALEHRDLARAQTLLAQAAELSPPGSTQELYAALSRLITSNEENWLTTWSRISASLNELPRSERLTIAWILVAKAKKTEQAKAIFSEVLQKDPANPTALAGLCACSLTSNNQGDILKTCGEAFALVNTYSPALLWAGLAYEKLERYADAYAALKQVVTLYPTEKLYEFTIVAAIATWRLEEAQQLSEQWKTRFGESPSGTFWQGVIALRSGKAILAKELLAKALESRAAPDQWVPFYAEALFENGSFTHAKEILQGLKDKPQTRAHAYLVLSMIALNEHATAQAQQFALTAIKQANKDAGSTRLLSEAYLALARTQLEASQSTDALRSLNRALEFDRRNIEAHYILGLISNKQQDHDRARAHFNNALAIYPSYEAAHLALQKLDHPPQNPDP